MPPGRWSTWRPARPGAARLRANAARYGLDPHLHRHTDVHLHVQSAKVPKEGASAGVTMAAALVSAATRRRVRAGVAMSGEITLAGQVLGVGGIAAKVLAAHRGGLARILLPLRHSACRSQTAVGIDPERGAEQHERFRRQVDHLVTAERGADAVTSRRAAVARSGVRASMRTLSSETPLAVAGRQAGKPGPAQK